MSRAGEVSTFLRHCKEEKMNVPTLVILLLVIAVCVAVVVNEVKKHKSGQGSCSCGCGGCSMADICHSTEQNQKDKS